MRRKTQTNVDWDVDSDKNEVICSCTHIKAIHHIVIFSVSIIMYGQHSIDFHLASPTTPHKRNDTSEVRAILSESYVHHDFKSITTKHVRVCDHIQKALGYSLCIIELPLSVIAFKHNYKQTRHL